mgnify:CR=1 FL=1
MNISEIREKYPDYNDLSDQQLADALHAKHYSDMPKDKFYSQLGISDNPTNMPDWLFHGISNLSKKLNPNSLNIAGNIAGDINNLVEGAPSAIGQFVSSTPRQALESGKQFAAHPLTAPTRAGASMLSTLLEGAKGAYNLPLNIQTYLGSKGVPGFKEGASLAESLKIGDTGLKKALLGEEQPGDVFFEKLPMILPFIKPGVNALSNAAEVSKKVPQLTKNAMGSIPPLRAKSIMEQMSGHKAEKMMEASKDYSSEIQECYAYQQPQ